MNFFTFTDVNIAFPYLMKCVPGLELEDTRNGKAYVFHGPVCLKHANPQNRVLFDPVRDANPFFHYMEAIWMFAGSNRVDFPATFAANIRNYSDDGNTMHGAYGKRWRYHFAWDQIEEVITMIKADPGTRRAVIAMWDPDCDLGKESKDFPCNTHIYFRSRRGPGPEDLGFLDMTICNRSNDLVWGMLGSNIVHFSLLHEYIAAAVGLQLGTLYQFTNNLHVYQGMEGKWNKEPTESSNWYATHEHLQFTRWAPNTITKRQAKHFLSWPALIYDYPENGIIKLNAMPMRLAWDAYKDGRLEDAIAYATQIYDPDWCLACTWWLRRRQAKLQHPLGAIDP